MTKLVDEIAGELDYDSGWCRSLSIIFFAEVVAIQLAFAADETEELEPIQREAFAEFWKSKDRLLRQAEAAIFSYYQSIRADILARVPKDSADTLAPRITSQDDLRAIVRLETLYFPEGFRNERRIAGLLAGCAWDPALGLAVRFEDEKIVDVGPQDILL